MSSSTDRQLTSDCAATSTPRRPARAEKEHAGRFRHFVAGIRRPSRALVTGIRRASVRRPGIRRAGVGGASIGCAGVRRTGVGRADFEVKGDRVDLLDLTFVVKAEPSRLKVRSIYEGIGSRRINARV
jgi:hypothetical protein